MFTYTAQRDDSEVMETLLEWSERKPTRGFDYYYHRIRKQGFPWNRKVSYGCIG